MKRLSLEMLIESIILGLTESSSFSFPVFVSSRKTLSSLQNIKRRLSFAREQVRRNRLDPDIAEWQNHRS